MSEQTKDVGGKKESGSVHPTHYLDFIEGTRLTEDDKKRLEEIGWRWGGSYSHEGETVFFWYRDRGETPAPIPEDIATKGVPNNIREYHHPPGLRRGNTGS